MKFSVFTPTRGRPQLLVNLIDSFWTKAGDIDNIEFLFWIDDDDIETIGCYQNYLIKLPLNIKAFINPRPASLNAAISFLANQATGQYIFNCNDDCEMLTENWDRKALERINQFKLENNIKDDIIYCATNDTSVDRDATKGYSSFPIISKEAVDILGFFMYPAFVGLGGDSSIFRLYNEIGRVVNCKELTLDHVYHNTIQKVCSPDRTAAEMRANTQKNYLDPFSFDISKEANLFRGYLRND